MRNDDGSVLVEAAIVLPVMLTVIIGGLDLGLGMVAATRRAALEMFPGKERAFDLIYKPQFQRLMHAVYRLQ